MFATETTTCSSNYCDSIIELNERFSHVATVQFRAWLIYERTNSPVSYQELSQESSW